MFTGIVKETGKVAQVSKTGSLMKLGISSSIIAKDASPSDSISVNGVCLTLTQNKKDLLIFEAISSTLKSTNIKRLKKGDHVNLEPALNMGEKMGGHFVLGHVDAELKLRRIVKRPDHFELEIELPSSFRKFIVANGSVAIEGISLTVKKILPKVFTVNIIPFTFEHTTLKYKRSGDFLNIEFDYLLKQSKTA